MDDLVLRWVMPNTKDPSIEALKSIWEVPSQVTKVIRPRTYSLMDLSEKKLASYMERLTSQILFSVDSFFAMSILYFIASPPN